MESALATIARTPRLLVVSDYDGTLAELATDAYKVHTHPGAHQALTRLAHLPETHVAILSGRHLDGLRQVADFGDEILFAGSHGAESDINDFELTPEQEAVLAAITAEFEAIAAPVPGAFVEHKPYHRVLHTIRVADEQQALDIYEQGQRITTPGASITAGKRIVEASPLQITKGTWIDVARAHVQATGVVFVGDDLTDEDGFAVLGAGDVSVKVGAGATQAQFRVPDVAAAGELFATLARLRDSATRVETDV
ncbi:MAG: trehalose-phosphatase [Corynebacterium sp.]|nr:trehalose-phosphatase [Corynebacterium sp.]